MAPSRVALPRRGPADDNGPSGGPGGAIANAAAAQAQAGIGQAVETAKTMSQTKAGPSNLLDGVLKAALGATGGG